MLKTIQKHVVLWVQSKTGVTLVFLVAMTFAATAVLMMFVFLCVAAYAWASVELGPVFGGLAHARGFLADCVDRSSRLGCGAAANPGKGHRGTGQQGENIARSQGVSARHPGWPRAWLAAPGTLIADRHSRCPMGTPDAQRCWPFRRRLMRMRRHAPDVNVESLR